MTDATPPGGSHPPQLPPSPLPGGGFPGRGPVPAAGPGATGQGNPPALAGGGRAKRFGGKIAVNGINLVVPAGSFYGLVGPNGAGKTTTLSMATGLLRPDAGRVIVAGGDVWADPAAAK